MDHVPLAPYEWIRWLSGKDAAVLLMALCQHIEAPTVDRAALTTLVQGWRHNAERALRADDWKASVDKYVEVTVDARLYYFSRDKYEREVMDEIEDQQQREEPQQNSS